MRRLITTLAFGMAVAGCAMRAHPGAAGSNVPPGTSSDVGAVPVAAAATPGVILNGLGGGSLDRGDRRAIREKTQYALEYGPSGQPMPWRNPHSGHYGAVIPARAYQDNGTYCREYQQTAVIGGQTQQSYGRACRQSDGTWKIQS